ncbi:MAG: hypothetical protein AAGD05_09665, partial [Bacteroidota bacterium]
NVIDTVDFSKKGHAQFLQQLESMVEEMEQPIVEQEDLETATPSLAESISDEFVEAEESAPSPVPDAVPETQSSGASSSTKEANQERMAQMETVMNQGMNFLAGLYKLSTGQDMGAEDQKVEIDRETGEVVMRFKLKL